METYTTTGHDLNKLSQPIDQLQHLMTDVESFLGDWLQRLEQLNASTPAPDAGLRKRMQEFEQEKIQWDAKRKRETQDIHDKAEELGKAWLRLEQEQRRFLQIRDSHAGSSKIAVAAIQAREPVGVEHSSDDSVIDETSPPQSTTSETAKLSEETASRRPSPIQGHRVRESAASQFAQLRREIESNRQQHRRA